jgi:hypothetical protein
MTGGDFLNCAERLAKSSDEADLRTAISRAYYGAYHMAVSLLRNQGVRLTGRILAAMYFRRTLLAIGRVACRQSDPTPACRAGESVFIAKTSWPTNQDPCPLAGPVNKSLVGNRNPPNKTDSPVGKPTGVYATASGRRLATKTCSPARQAGVGSDRYRRGVRSGAHAKQDTAPPVNRRLTRHYAHQSPLMSRR